MPISIDEIRNASNFVKKATAKTINEAKASNMATAFLCHSHLDADLVKGTINLLNNDGWNVYVDWADSSMPAIPNRETAQLIQKKIVALNYFLFLATPNSMVSRWCPWEIGYATGEKPIDNILIIPTTDRSGKWHGNEYLQLYRKIDVAKEGGFGVFHPGS